MRQEDSTVLVAIYNEVDYYPPTINALHILAQRFQKVIVLEVITNVDLNVVYPENILITTILRKSDSRGSRFSTFVEFQRAFNRLIKTNPPDLILLYDPVAAMAGWISLQILHKKAIWWYHNHDVTDKKFVRTFSLLHFAYYLERQVLSHLNIFTIPSTERMALYNLTRFNGIRQVIPNFPSLRLFSEVSSPNKADNEIILIYQGNISEGHGLEEILKLLPCRINNKSLKLRLIGFSNPSYDAKLKAIIESHNLQEMVAILDKVSYQALPFITRQCHIGLAIYTKMDVMNSTLGTASNKIYEYTAIGLPFLYFDNPHFKKYLGKMEWAFPTDLTAGSILQAVQKMDSEYDRLSQMARNEFISHRNYEKVFTPVMDAALDLVHSKTNRN
jgi:hypothetical protein